MCAVLLADILPPDIISVQLLCPAGRTIRAAIIHDWLYSTAILSRKQAD
ncbi:MAG: DUF1353 domain-containing protein [Lentisphaerae bacterium]|nr:DUF1353 domain-containing protein [Lentisphaerota bacterium]